MRNIVIRIFFIVLVFFILSGFVFPDFVFDRPLLTIGVDKNKAKEKNYVWYDFFMVREALIGPDDLIYALDFKDNTVSKFDLKGNFIGKYGRTGQGPGELNSPSGMTFVDKDLWIANTRNFRIEVFHKSGKGSSFHVNGIAMPATIASSGVIRGIAGGSMKNITFLNNQNKEIYKPKIKLNRKFGKYISLWLGGVRLEEL